MNKGLIKALIAIWAIIAVMLTGLIVYAIVYGGNSWNIFRWNGWSLMVQKNETVPLDNCNKISLDFSSEDIMVQTTDETELRVVEKSNRKLREEEKFTINKDGNTITVKKGDTPIVFNIFSFGYIGRKIEVYIPKSYAKDLDIHVNSGNVTFNSNINLNNIKCAQSSGNFNSGFNITGNEVTLNTSSGNIKAESLETKSYDITTSSGNADISSLSGSGQVSASSGNIKINYKDISDYSKVSAHSGNLKLSLPNTLSFEFDGQCTSGDISANFDLDYKNKKGNKATAKVGQGPYKKVSADTSSGNINISTASRP